MEGVIGVRTSSAISAKMEWTGGLNSLLSIVAARAGV